MNDLDGKRESILKLKIEKRENCPKFQRQRMNCSIKASKNKRSGSTMELESCNMNNNKKYFVLHSATELMIFNIENIHLKYELKNITKYFSSRIWFSLLRDQNYINLAMTNEAKYFMIRGIRGV